MRMNFEKTKVVFESMEISLGKEKLAIHFVSLIGKNLTWKKILVSTKENLLTLEDFFRTLKINQRLAATQGEICSRKTA